MLIVTSRAASRVHMDAIRPAAQVQGFLSGSFLTQNPVSASSVPASDESNFAVTSLLNHFCSPGLANLLRTARGNVPSGSPLCSWLSLSLSLSLGIKAVVAEHHWPTHTDIKHWPVVVVPGRRRPRAPAWTHTDNMRHQEPEQNHNSRLPAHRNRLKVGTTSGTPTKKTAD